MEDRDLKSQLPSQTHRPNTGEPLADPTACSPPLGAHPSPLRAPGCPDSTPWRSTSLHMQQRELSGRVAECFLGRQVLNPRHGRCGHQQQPDGPSLWSQTGLHHPLPGPADRIQSFFPTVLALSSRTTGFPGGSAVKNLPARQEPQEISGS